MSAELIVALDVPDGSAIPGLLNRMPPALQWYKIGLELFCAEGPAALAPLRDAGKRIFLDLKLHDIPRTVERAVASAARHGAGLLTLHASGGPEMIRAAARARDAAGPSAPRLLAVTVLTSLDATDLDTLGVHRSPADQAAALARMAVDAGADGIVCSAQEAGRLRALLGPGPLMVTPGIRLPSDAVGDQKRVSTPGAAVRAGATHLVVGRPILDAPSPADAVRAILSDMEHG
ncbi:MAG: orotidine-5'-phosphate decarboxylase [Kiritimatiellae bacterium]|nr:orotidine-5'-phosphate decarboxylase [Kiritimatiellia bacterium]